MNAEKTRNGILLVRLLAAALAALFAVVAAGCAMHNPGTLVPPPVSLRPGNL